jgi:hypothetical protein
VSEGIIVFQSSSATGTLQRIDSKDAARKKRAHYKSRRGCIECKRRRVKVSLSPFWCHYDEWRVATC